MSSYKQENSNNLELQSIQKTLNGLRYKIELIESPYHTTKTQTAVPSNKVHLIYNCDKSSLLRNRLEKNTGKRLAGFENKMLRKTFGRIDERDI